METEGSNPMPALRYLLMILGLGLFGSASALAAYDIFLATQLRRLLHREPSDRILACSVTYKIGFPGPSAGQGLR
jgi:hypothetical protein